MPIQLAHKLTKRLADVRKKGLVDFLRPDGKSQVTVRYDANNQPIAIDTVVLSTQHTESVKYKTLREAVMDEVHQAGAAGGAGQQQDQVLHQPDRPLRGRRPDG